MSALKISQVKLPYSSDLYDIEPINAVFYRSAKPSDADARVGDIYRDSDNIWQMCVAKTTTPTLQVTWQPLDARYVPIVDSLPVVTNLNRSNFEGTLVNLKSQYTTGDVTYEPGLYIYNQEWTAFAQGNFVKIVEQLPEPSAAVVNNLINLTVADVQNNIPAGLYICQENNGTYSWAQFSTEASVISDHNVDLNGIETPLKGVSVTHTTENNITTYFINGKGVVVYNSVNALPALEDPYTEGTTVLLTTAIRVPVYPEENNVFPGGEWIYPANTLWTVHNNEWIPLAPSSTIEIATQDLYDALVENDTVQENVTYHILESESEITELNIAAGIGIKLTEDAQHITTIDNIGFVYQGEVEDYDHLPNDAEIGSVYIIQEDYKQLLPYRDGLKSLTYYKAGSKFLYNKIGNNQPTWVCLDRAELIELLPEEYEQLHDDYKNNGTLYLIKGENEEQTLTAGRGIEIDEGVISTSAIQYRGSSRTYAELPKENVTKGDIYVVEGSSLAGEGGVPNDAFTSADFCYPPFFQVLCTGTNNGAPIWKVLTPPSAILISENNAYTYDSMTGEQTPSTLLTQLTTTYKYLPIIIK